MSDASRYIPLDWQLLQMGPLRGEPDLDEESNGVQKLIGVLVAQSDCLAEFVVLHALEGVADIAVVGAVRNAEEFLRRVDWTRVGVIIRNADDPLDGEGGMMDWLSEQGRCIPGVIIITDLDLGHVVRSYRQGVTGWISKDFVTSLLPDAVRAVAAGALWADPDSAGQMLEEIARLAEHARQIENPLAKLTDRERQILADIAEGLTYAQIAARRFLSVSTVKREMRFVRGTLGARSRAEILKALQQVSTNRSDSPA